MALYKCEFTGRRIGTMGVFRKCTDFAHVKTPEDAKQHVLTRYEAVHGFSAKVVAK